MAQVKQIFHHLKNRIDVWREIPFSPNVRFADNYIFIHIPKTAGTSIASALGIAHSNHFSAQYYRSKLGKKYDRMFKFCIVRNPWDRFLSLYDYARLRESFYHSAIHPESASHGKHVDYDVVSKVSLAECARLLIQGAFQNKETFPWRAQSYWLTDHQGKSMVDYIGRYEELEKSVKYISSRIKIDIDLPHLNRSRSNPSHYRDRMNQETAELIGQYYAQDIKLFGYSF